MIKLLSSVLTVGLGLGLHPSVAQAEIHAGYASPYVWLQDGIEPVGVGESVWNATAWRNEKVYAQILIIAGQSEEISDLDIVLGDFRNSATDATANLGRLHYPRFAIGDPTVRNCETPREQGATARIADALSQSPVRRSVVDTLSTVWVEIDVPADLMPGQYSGEVAIRSASAELVLPISLDVRDASLPNLGEGEFHLDLWQFPMSQLEQVNARSRGAPIQAWTDAHYAILEPSYRYLAGLGQRTVTTYIKSGALGAPSMVEWILDPDRNRLTFDYSVFDKHVEQLADWGIDGQISAFSPVGWNKDEIPVSLVDSGQDGVLQAPPGSQAFRAAWSTFLADFRRHLESKGWFERTVLYLDEVPAEEMSAVVSVIRENGQDWKIGLAYSHVQEDAILSELYDVSGIFRTEQEVDASASSIRTFYTSCTQLRPNNYLATNADPADNTAFAWYALARGYDGYLRWAFDNWRAAENLDRQDSGFTAGDSAFVYLADIDDPERFYPSIRSELLRDGIEDFERWQIAARTASACGRVDLVAQLDSIRERFTVEALEAGQSRHLVELAQSDVLTLADQLILDPKCRLDAREEDQ